MRDAHAAPRSGEVNAKLGARGWRRSIVINGLGALATALVLAVFLWTKFIHGAWIVVVVVPLLVADVPGHSPLLHQASTRSCNWATSLLWSPGTTGSSSRWYVCTGA